MIASFFKAIWWCLIGGECYARYRVEQEYCACGEQMLGGKCPLDSPDDESVDGENPAQEKPK